MASWFVNWFADLKGVSHECKVVYECQVTFELTPSYLMNAISYECQKWTHETYINESKFYILAMLKHKVINWQLTKQWHSFLSFINCVHYCLVHVFVINRLFGHRILFEWVWSMLHIHPLIQTRQRVSCHTEISSLS